MKYEPHPAALVIPKPSELEYQDLKTSIAERGQRESIVIYSGMVLDGLSRLRACEELGIKPQTRQYNVETDGPDIDAFVIDANVNRRQLTVAQRAAIALGVVKRLQGEAPIEHGEAATDADEAKPRPKPLREVAAQANLSKRALEMAVEADRDDPKAIDRMREGKETLHKIAGEVKEAKRKADRSEYLTEEHKAQTGKKLWTKIVEGKCFPTALQLRKWFELPVERRRKLEPVAMEQLAIDLVVGFEELDMEKSYPIQFLLLAALLADSQRYEKTFDDGPSANDGVKYRVIVEAYVDAKK